MEPKITIGLPQMYKEPGERRDFLPSFIARMTKAGAQLLVEHGYGAEMGFSEDDYRKVAPSVKFIPHKETYRQDYVLVLRYPSDDEVRLMKSGACLISMLHYPTRPDRIQFLRDHDLEAVSLDEIKDDTGRRLIENLRSVAWNGVEAAFKTLRGIYPESGFDSRAARPLRSHFWELGQWEVMWLPQPSDMEMKPSGKRWLERVRQG
jgi:alanine dehydrogenase